jgi:hypothetical protein
MQRSSNKIGALATALAKAQSELANPEKSLIATLPSPVPGGSEKSFRYASLASGLELVRKCLGQHEIATVQATAIDRDTGLIRLTTMLVHASGEWMSSDWPVCPVAETASPHRMGAALTYARRYALFTLVGIAGEDDLDAPDLPAAAGPADNGLPERVTVSGGQQVSPSLANAPGQPPKASGRPVRPECPKPAVLAGEASSSLRDRLVSELGKVEGAGGLTAWAHLALPRKNQLTNADALAVEAAFEAQLNHLGEVVIQPKKTPAEDDFRREVTVLSKPVRERNRVHLKYVAGQPCLVCGRTPSDAHHIKFADSWTVGRKVSDRFTVPLCRLHHRELHRRGRERVWWQQKGIEPLNVAKALWAKTQAPPPDDIADEPGHEIDGSGRHVPRAGLTMLVQNDETKPIERPEAQ